MAGVVGIALFADMRVNQNSFVSENALLPGYVVTKYQQQSVSTDVRTFLFFRTYRIHILLNLDLGL